MLGFCVTGLEKLIERRAAFGQRTVGLVSDQAEAVILQQRSAAGRQGPGWRAPRSPLLRPIPGLTRASRGLRSVSLIDVGGAPPQQWMFYVEVGEAGTVGYMYLPAGINHSFETSLEGRGREKKAEDLSEKEVGR